MVVKVSIVKSKFFKKPFRSRLAVLIVMLFLCAAGYTISSCAVKKGKIYVQNGKTYGKTDSLFKSKWDDFYNRGLSYGEGGFWKEAAEDFKTAISKRPNDQRRTRTYGLHFIDYFPNRELGIAYFHAGRFQEAMDALEKSLASEETARAKYYLNKSRRAYLEQAHIDTVPPSLSVQFPPSEYRTNEFAVSVHGNASDNFYVSGMIYNGRSSVFELSSKKASFEERFPLKPGRNIITIQAEDILGKTSSPVSIRIEVDRDGPLVLLRSLQNPDGSVSIQGAAFDSSGIARLNLNGSDIVVSQQRLVQIERKISPVGIPADSRIRFEARDVIGNVTTGWIIASAARDSQDISFAGLNDGDVTYRDILCVRGCVRMAGIPRDLTLNSIPLLPGQEDTAVGEFLEILKKAGSSSLYFSRITGCREGKNSIIVSYTGTEGVRSVRSIEITRQIPLVRKLSSRLSVAMLPFAENGNAGAGIAGYVQVVLKNSLTGQERFNVLEKAGVDRLIGQDTKAQQPLDVKEAAQIGRTLGADTVMVGEISGSERSVSIDAQLIETDTSLVLAEKDVYWEGTVRADLRLAIDQLARKFKKHFPLCEGTVVVGTAGEAVISMGTDLSICRGMKLLVFQETSQRGGADSVIDVGSDTELLALLAARDVDRSTSRAEILKLFSTRSVKAGDRVITK